MMEQQTLFKILGLSDDVVNKSEYIVDRFSANGFCSEVERDALERKYESILEATSKFDRKSVSYQLSKKGELHSWLKYKEGFFS